MTPLVDTRPDPGGGLVRGDARRLPLASGSVHAVVTSPPYWSLRDYGTATWVGGDSECSHNPSQEWIDKNFNANSAFGNGAATQSAAARLRWYRADRSCPACGARRVDRQIGLEESPDAYVAAMVAVFRQVWRVLRDDGTVWLNLGDSYSAVGKSGGGEQGRKWKENGAGHVGPNGGTWRPAPVGLKPKDLIGIPWRVALALQADGWYLRSDIIWSKPNPMPESVEDRPTKAHEYLFLLAKGERYFYDADAIREPAEYGRVLYKPDDPRAGRNASSTIMYKSVGDGREEVARGAKRPAGCDPSAGRNRRSVWEVATAPFPGSHFATFPPRLIEPCIRAGTSERGVCPECGGPWERVVERESIELRPNSESKRAGCPSNGRSLGQPQRGSMASRSETTGWHPACRCNAGPPVPATVFDPFIGSGTTIVVANALGRHGIGLDLSQDYLAMAARRISRPHAPAPRGDRGASPGPLFANGVEAGI